MYYLLYINIYINGHLNIYIYKWSLMHDIQSAEISQIKMNIAYIHIYIEREAKSTLVYTQPVSLVLLFKCVQLMLPFILSS